jgi:transcriptional regulator PpsR
VKQFRTAGKSLGSLDADAAANAIAASADIALVIDRNGVIRDMAFASDELSEQIDAALFGQTWSETVTSESRMKVAALLSDAARPEGRRWRQLNHSAPDGSSVPVLYSAIRIGEEGNVLAVGRDLRPIAALQQRVVEAEQSQERDYARLRHAETRYRQLFQLASEAVLIVDADSRTIVDANPAASALFGATLPQLVGRAFIEGFESTTVRAVEQLLAKVGATGRGDEVRGRITGQEAEFLVAAALFRQDATSQFLVRLNSSRVGAGSGTAQVERSRLVDLMEALPDGLVVTNPDGVILAANRAFLELLQLAAEEQVRGQSLDRWLGRPGVDFDVLTTNLRQYGAVRLFPTTVLGAYGTPADVEISAVAVLDAAEPCFGFAVRNVNRRAAAGIRPTHALPRSVEQLTELVGKVSLKDLVRETTDVIERLCIEAALQLTQDNRASAAEMLGLSRQSLYVKLRRFGLGDLGGGEEAAPEKAPEKAGKKLRR